MRIVPARRRSVADTVVQPGHLSGPMTTAGFNSIGLDNRVLWGRDLLPGPFNFVTANNRVP